MSLKYIVLLAFFFLLPNIASTLHVKQYVLYFMFVLSLVALLQKKQKDSLLKTFCVFYIILFAVRFFTGMLSGSVQSIIIMAMPMMIAFTIPEESLFYNNKKYFQIMYYCVTGFFFLTVSFAIIEYLGHFHILNYQNTTYEDGLAGFRVVNRSVALAGASLTSALIVSGMLAFILNSDLKLKVKIFLWTLGFLSLLCFQGRMSIVVSLAYLFYFVFTHMKKNMGKNIIAVILLVMVCALVFSAFYLGFGSRLIHTSADDSSIDVRSRMYEYLFNSDWRNFMWGMSMRKLQNIMLEMRVLIIESFFIIHILLFGLLFTFVAYFLYGKLLSKFFKEYSARVKIEIISLYVFLASISNSFASGFTSLTFLFICSRFFSPSIFCNIVPKKYLEK